MTNASCKVLKASKLPSPQSKLDYLYLDLSGIIHNCTHNDSDGPIARMTGDKMFIAIFTTIELAINLANDILLIPPLACLTRRQLTQLTASAPPQQCAVHLHILPTPRPDHLRSPRHPATCKT